MSLSEKPELLEFHLMKQQGEGPAFIVHSNHQEAMSDFELFSTYKDDIDEMLTSLLTARDDDGGFVFNAGPAPSKPDSPPISWAGTTNEVMLDIGHTQFRATPSYNSYDETPKHAIFLGKHNTDELWIRMPPNKDPSIIVWHGEESDNYTEVSTSFAKALAKTNNQNTSISVALERATKVGMINDQGESQLRVHLDPPTTQKHTAQSQSPSPGM